MVDFITSHHFTFISYFLYCRSLLRGTTQENSPRYTTLNRTSDTAGWCHFRRLYFKRQVLITADTATPPTPPLLCAVPSAASGEFSFKSLPPGNYQLVRNRIYLFLHSIFLSPKVPRYQNKDLTFEVKPSKVTFTVSNNSVLIEVCDHLDILLHAVYGVSLLIVACVWGTWIFCFRKGIKWRQQGENGRLPSAPILLFLEWYTWG